MKGQDSMTSTSLVMPCFDKKFVTNIQRLTKTKYEIPQSRLRITTYEFLNRVFQCTHVIANSSLNIADQERRERNPNNKKHQLKTAIITQHKNFLLSIHLQNCSFYNHLLFDQTDLLRFPLKRPSIELTCYP